MASEREDGLSPSEGEGNDLIAKSCGYGSANALRKVFAAETGKNPLVWRKRAE